MIHNATPKLDLNNFTRAELADLLTSWNLPASHAALVWKYLYREQAESIEAMIGLPARVRERLASETAIALPSIVRETHSSDGLTRKYLLELRDGRQIETVLMKHTGRATACLSSQVGCAMGCGFCATAQMGFSRHLSAGEIVAQALHGSRRQKLRNVVLMGMGEPLHNYDAVLKAVDILRDPGGLAIGAKQITLSTVGVVPGIIRLADERRTVSLAVSLHAATQTERAALVPAARVWPLDELLEACRYYVAKLERRIFFEWTLIDGTNDSAEQATVLGELLSGMPAHVNLIPLNPIADYSGQPSGRDAAERFQAILRRHGLPSTIRQRRGIDIAAGCGQLAVAEHPG